MILDDTKAAVELALRRHDRAAALFSGGRQSVVLASLLEPYRDRVELVWVNTGAMFPHMVEFVRSYGARFKLTELHSDQPSRLRTVGLPVRMIPVANTPIGDAVGDRRHKVPLLGDWVSCCMDLRGRPAVEYLIAQGTSLLFHGQSRVDGIGMMARVAAEVCSPLWDWSAEDLSRFVEEQQLELPAQYAEGYASSVECWNCTAEIDAARFRWMAAKHPEHLAALRPMMAATYGAIESELIRAQPAISLALAPAKEAEEGSTQLPQSARLH